jgi:hypothetical protein
MKDNNIIIINITVIIHELCTVHLYYYYLLFACI